MYLAAIQRDCNDQEDLWSERERKRDVLIVFARLKHPMIKHRCLASV